MKKYYYIYLYTLFNKIVIILLFLKKILSQPLNNKKNYLDIYLILKFNIISFTYFNSYLHVLII